MYGERPKGSKLVHVKMIDGTREELRALRDALNDKLILSGGYQFIVTNENIEITDLNKLVEKLQLLK